MDKICKKLRKNKSKSKENIKAASSEKIPKTLTINKTPDQSNDDFLPRSGPNKMHFLDIKGARKTKSRAKKDPGKLPGENLKDTSKTDIPLNPKEKNIIEQLLQKLAEAKQRLEDEKKTIQALKEAIENEKQGKMFQNQPKGILKKRADSLENTENAKNVNNLSESQSLNIEFDPEGNVTILPSDDPTESLVIDFTPEGVAVSTAKDGATNQNTSALATSPPNDVQGPNLDSSEQNKPNAGYPYGNWADPQYENSGVARCPSQGYNSYSYITNSGVLSNFASTTSYNSVIYGGRIRAATSCTLQYAPSYASSYNAPSSHQPPYCEYLDHRDMPTAGSSYDCSKICSYPAIRDDCVLRKEESKHSQPKDNSIPVICIEPIIDDCDSRSEDDKNN